MGRRAASSAGLGRRAARHLGRPGSTLGLGVAGMPNQAFIAAWSPKNGLYQIMPARIAPAASTPSGISIEFGLSCAWSWA